MNSDGKFWILTWSIVAASFCVIIISSLIYWDSYNEKVARLVEGGINPVHVNCALQDSYGNTPVCIILATKKGK